MILFYQETLFIWGSKRYVKEGSGNKQISPKGPCWVTWRGGFILLQTLRDRCRRTLEMKCLSPWEFYEGNLKGGLHKWGL